jgi:VRR-NUC domain
MSSRRRVRIVRPEDIPPDETWERVYAFGEALKDSVREGTLQTACEETAARYGWTVYHETDSRKSPKGLPDLIMLSPIQRDGSVVLAMLELKSAKGKLTIEQEIWQTKLGMVDRLVTGVLRPAGWLQFVALCYDPLSATDVNRRVPRSTTDDAPQT